MNQPSEPILKNYLLRLARQVPGYSLARVAPPLVAFVLLPIFSHYITPADLGTYALLQVVAAIFGFFTTLGVGSMTPFYYTEEPDPVMRRKKVGNLLLCATGINTLSLGLFLLAGPYLFELAFPTLQFYPYILITLLTGVLPPYLDIPSNIWQIKERPHLTGVRNLIQAVFTGFLQLYLIVSLGWGLLGLLWGVLGGTLFSACLSLTMVRKELSFWIKLPELGKALRLGLPMVPTSIFGKAYQMADRVILERYVSHDMIGLYYLALRFGDLLSQGTSIINQSFLPILYKEGGQPQRRPELARLITLSLAVICAGSLAVNLLAEWYVRYSMASSYHGAILFICFAVAARLLKGSHGFPHLVIWFRKQSQYFPLITVIPMLASIGLNLWLIPIHGVYGACLVLVFSYLLQTALTYYFAQRALRLPYQYPRMAAMVAASGLLIFGLSPLMLGSVSLLTRTILSSLLFLAVAVPVVLRTARQAGKAD